MYCTLNFLTYTFYYLCTAFLKTKNKLVFFFNNIKVFVIQHNVIKFVSDL